jgi:hypothetical protein
MEHRDQVMEWTKASLEAYERLLPLQQRLIDLEREHGNEDEALVGEAEKARTEHQLWWRRRYLDHLEMGGEVLAPGDEWAMHHEHELTVEESDDGDEIILFCRTCLDSVWANVPDESGEGMAAKYAEHLGHDIRIRRDEGPEERGVAIYGFDIGIDCYTCQHVEGQDGIPLFSGVVSAWFDELWDG